MNIQDLQKEAIRIREKYAEFERNRNGKEWTRAEIMEGFVGDVGDLMKLVMAKEGVRHIDNVDEKLKHELADCLWSILVLASKYEIDLEESFLKTMKELENRLANNRE